MRLLTLPSEVIKLIETRQLTAGHAKMLVGLENALFVANKIIEKKFSVRRAESFIKLIKSKRNNVIKSKDSNIKSLEMSISEKVGLNVIIQNNKRNQGKITIEYKDLNQLNRIIEIIKKNY